MKAILKKVLKLLVKEMPFYQPRAAMLRRCGYTVGKDVYVGEDLIIIDEPSDWGMIAIGDGVAISPRVTLVVSSRPNFSRIAPYVPVEPVRALRRGFPYTACYAGLMGFEDGVLELIESIRYVVHDLGRRDILFVLLGDGAVRPHALAKVEAWGLEAFVDMPGMIHDKLLLRQYMSTADALLSPEPLTPLNAKSTFIKIGEYMSIGKPIVAYDLQETRYTAQEATVYVEPADAEGFGQAIMALLDDPERARRMGEIGRQRILNQFGWEHQQQNLFRAYAVALA